MLAYVLKAMGDDLTAVVGAHVPKVIFYQWKKNIVNNIHAIPYLYSSRRISVAKHLFPLIFQLFILVPL